MKSFNHLFKRLIDFDNIRSAIKSAAKHKLKRREVRHALDNLYSTSHALFWSLGLKSWKPPKHYGREIIDHSTRKKRIIVTPKYVMEQCVHHALINIIKPLFLPSFYRWSCGSVPGRGQEQMHRYIRKKIDLHPEKCKYVVKLDIKKFFDSIDVEAVISYFNKKIRDNNFKIIINNLLHGNEIHLKDKTCRKGGIPIGFYTSPWIANIILNQIDHLIKDKYGVYLYARFMDDMVLFDSNKRKLKRVISEVRTYLLSFNLKFKYEPQIHRFNCNSRAITFTGFVIRPSRTVLCKRVFYKASRTGRRLCSGVQQGNRVTGFIASRLVSYIGRFMACFSMSTFYAYILTNNIVNLKMLAFAISKKQILKNKKDRIMKQVLILLSLMLLVGCGHNRLLIDKSIGLAVTVPCGDLGSFKVGIGSTETTTAELRGGSSLETETAEGSGLFSSQVGTTRVTKFKSNQQANEGNLVTIMTDPNVPERSKLILSESLARASTAPEFKAGALQTREAVIYSDGYEGQLENDFQTTGIDRIGDNVKETVTETLDNLNPFESLKEALSEGLGAINKTAAIALAIVIAIIILIVFLSVRKPRKPKKRRSVGSTSTPTPEPPVMEKDPSDLNPEEDEFIDVEPSPIESSEEEDPEEKKSWLTRGFLRLIRLVVIILTFWKKLKPSTQKAIVDGGVKTLFKKRKTPSEQQ